MKMLINKGRDIIASIHLTLPLELIYCGIFRKYNKENTGVYIMQNTLGVGRGGKAKWPLGENEK